MNILALETSTKHFGLAVMRDGKIVRRHEVVLNKVLSDSIVPAIEKILKQAKTPLAKLDGFAVGLGPGSFTSLRVGMATVKAVAFVTQKPVVGLSSLDAIAANVREEPCDQVCVISDARRNLLYSRLYQMTDDGPRANAECHLSNLESLLDTVEGETLFVGDGIPLFRDEILRRYAEAAKLKATDCRPLFADEKFWFPKADAVATLAWPRFLKKKFDDINKLLPMYLYPETCQIQRR